MVISQLRHCRGVKIHFLGITICVRAQPHVWPTIYLIQSGNIRLGLDEYHYAAGFVELGLSTDHSAFIFSFPDGKISDFGSFVSFCLAFDKPRAGVSLTINGKVALNETWDFIRTSNLAPGNAPIVNHGLLWCYNRL